MAGKVYEYTPAELGVNAADASADITGTIVDVQAIDSFSLKIDYSAGGTTSGAATLYVDLMEDDKTTILQRIDILVLASLATSHNVLASWGVGRSYSVDDAHADLSSVATSTGGLIFGKFIRFFWDQTTPPVGGTPTLTLTMHGKI